LALRQLLAKHKNHNKIINHTKVASAARRQTVSGGAHELAAAGRGRRKELTSRKLLT